MIKFLYFFKHLVEFFSISLIFLIFNLLPYNISTKIITTIFLYIGKLSKNHIIAIENCKIVYPNLNEYQISEIVNNSWKNLGKTFYELTRLKELFLKKNLINIKGRENLDLLKKQNIPAIFFSIHQSNWEICVPLLDRMGFKIGAIYRHVNNKYIDNFIYRKRKNSLISKDSFYTPKGKKSAKDIIEGINNKKSIFLLIDQKDSAGDYINLFGRPVKTQTGFLKIARKYQMPIIPVKNKRLENNKFEITFQNPLNHTNDKISDENKMLEIHKIIEKWIKEEPSQWFWQHKRFN